MRAGGPQLMWRDGKWWLQQEPLIRGMTMTAGLTWYYIWPFDGHTARYTTLQDKSDVHNIWYNFPFFTLQTLFPKYIITPLSARSVAHVRYVAFCGIQLWCLTTFQGVKKGLIEVFNNSNSRLFMFMLLNFSTWTNNLFQMASLLVQKVT